MEINYITAQQWWGKKKKGFSLILILQSRPLNTGEPAERKGEKNHLIYSYLEGRMYLLSAAFRFVFFSLVSLAATSFRDDSLYAFHPPGDLLGGPERASGVAVVVVVGGVGWGDKQRGREEVRRRESEGGRAM